MALVQLIQTDLHLAPDKTVSVSISWSFRANELSEGGEVLMRPMALVESLNGLVAAVMAVALACSDELLELGVVWFAPFFSFWWLRCRAHCR